MSNICYASGYGVKLEDIEDLLQEEFQEPSSVDLTDNLSQDTYICCFCGENDYLYIPDIKPYEKALFNSHEEMDCYFFNQLKPILKEDCTQEQLSKYLDDIFDWDYC